MYQRIFGLTENKTTENIQGNVIYGFAYYNSTIGWWNYYIGSFPYLWGIFITLNMAEDKLSDKEPDSKAYTFLYLDQKYEPIKLIDRAKLDPFMLASIGAEGLKSSVTMVDLSSTGWGSVPPMSFEPI